MTEDLLDSLSAEPVRMTAQKTTKLSDLHWTQLRSLLIGQGQKYTSREEAIRILAGGSDSDVAAPVTSEKKTSDKKKIKKPVFNSTQFYVQHISIDGSTYSQNGYKYLLNGFCLGKEN